MNRVALNSERMQFMRSFEYIITDPLGLHARPAGLFYKEASLFESVITVSKGAKTANAKRIFSLMGLNIKHGDRIRIDVEGADEDMAAEKMDAFLRDNL